MEEISNPIDTDKTQNVRDRLTKLSQGIMWAEQRSITVGDEFIRLEVQVATILFTFSGLFLDKFDAVHLGFASESMLFVMRLSFSLSLVFLLISLACGLLHLKTREKFCDTVLDQRVRRYNKWREVLELKNVTFKEAEAFEKGSSLGSGLTVAEPSWTWILQTVCLAVGVLGLFTLALVFLFNQ